jgi:hypothetical protein
MPYCYPTPWRLCTMFLFEVCTGNWGIVLL